MKQSVLWRLRGAVIGHNPVATTAGLLRYARNDSLKFLVRIKSACSGEEKPMRKLLLIVGFIALVLGLLWIGQGTGVIKWPASSFMISQIQWAGYGAALAVVGLVLIWQSRR